MLTFRQSLHVAFLLLWVASAKLGAQADVQDFHAEVVKDAVDLAASQGSARKDGSMEDLLHFAICKHAQCLDTLSLAPCCLYCLTPFSRN